MIGMEKRGGKKKYTLVPGILIVIGDISFDSDPEWSSPIFQYLYVVPGVKSATNDAGCVSPSVGAPAEITTAAAFISAYTRTMLVLQYYEMVQPGK